MALLRLKGGISMIEYRYQVAIRLYKKEAVSFGETTSVDSFPRCYFLSA
jgi:predicted HTH domain antitoxin